MGDELAIQLGGKVIEQLEFYMTEKS